MQSYIGGLALGLFLIVVGITHLVIPTYYRRLVPRWIPGARIIVFTTGIVEMVVGIMLLLPATRTIAAWSAGVLITLYLVSHFDALARCRTVASKDDVLHGLPGSMARVIVNLAYIAWAVWIATS